MDELDELRTLICHGDYEAALALIDELDAMSRDDKLTKIESYMRLAMACTAAEGNHLRLTQVVELVDDLGLARYATV